MRKYNSRSNICGKIIKKYRIEKKMSREELAAKLQLSGINIDRTHIFRIENESVIIKDFELIAICKILNISYEELQNNL